MRFGVFYELQLPKPWNEGDEHRMFREALDQGLPPEVASTHLRSAETSLEEVLGVISVEDVLDVVFREFCVGK